jgi:hypothetical protein
MSSLPVGYVFMDEASNVLKIETPETPIRDRPLKMLCAHRIRNGAQWEVRRNLTDLCIARFQEFSTILTDEISEGVFQQQVRRHPFVLCAQGGGLDPSPKAWFCIANGSIPIIKSSVLDDAYSQLPVAFVDDWTDDCLSLEKLLCWVDELRAQTVHRLSLDYWWRKIVEVSF